MAKQAGKQSAKQRFISFIERKILSGEFAVGQKLPSERELAEQTGISRIIVHAGLVELATKNVLRIVPRQGTYVKDFKKEGTLELYGALLKYKGTVERDLFRSLIEFRETIETAAAEKAARNRTQEDIETLRRLLADELQAASVEEAARLDYQMHLQIAKAAGNIIFPMTMRSIEEMYISLVTTFYELQKDRAVVRRFHEQLILAIENGDGRKANAVMKTMLDQGRDVLEKYYQDRK